MKYDAVIIGTGQAGPTLARSLAQSGYSTAIIEEARFGGTCVNTGCTPTKAYIASARRAFVAKNSSSLGVSSGEVRVDLQAIKKRKDDLVEASASGLKEALEETENLTVVEGKGIFTGPNTIQVEEKTITADKIFINTGGKPRIPDGFDRVEYLTNESMLELTSIPGHLIIAGGGYVGLEFAQMFRRFGSEVTIIEMGSRLLGKEDPDVSEAIKEILIDEGIEIRLNAKCMTGKMDNGEVIVNINCTEGDPEVRGSHLLIATGRIPNTAALQLEKAGVETDEKGFITVNDQLQTNINHIWALGDCNGEGAFTHTAYNDYQIVSSHLLGGKKRTLSDRFSCYAAYIDPPFARVGMNATEIKEKGIKAKVAHIPMCKIGRAKEKGETKGFLKIFIDEENDHILGAGFLGVGADEYIHVIIDIMYAGAPYTTIRDAVHIHPTVSELIPTMLEELEDL